MARQRSECRGFSEQTVREKISISTEQKVSEAYREYAAELRRFLASRSNCFAIAEDLTQEAFIRLYNFDGIDNIRNMRSYLMRVGLNLLIDHKRSMSARSQPSSWVDIERIPDIRDDKPGADQVYYYRLEMNRFVSILDQLSESCRQIFWMSRIDGLRNRDIADNLGVCMSTVEKNINRAARHCRAQWHAAEAHNFESFTV